MKTKRFFDWIGLCALVLLMTACEGHVEYQKESTTFFFRINNMGASYVNLVATPANDRVFYYANVIKKTDYTPRTDDWRFMSLTMHDLVSKYEQWHYEQLMAGENYIAPFSSYFLEYGVGDFFFTSLEPNTDYYAFAFAVNPESKEGLGVPTFVPFHTPDIRNTGLTFDVKLDQSSGFVVIKPSNKYDTYLWEIVSEDTYNKWANNENARENAILKYLERYGHVDLHKGDIASDCTPWMEHGHTYYFVVVGYDKEPTTSVFSFRCEY